MKDVFLDKWGTRGYGNGQFKNQFGVAVGATSGTVFVADTFNNRIQKFDSTTALKTVSISSGTCNGQLAGLQGVAVDPYSGTVFVADNNNNRIQSIYTLHLTLLTALFT